ncbi:hypothetical protein, partial [Stutzerimonas nitrititolerans]|uniref:hypothetical protein n=1 Tax=Stutzerimonas nitrititolerans TaxID=2482751 RepID=UPI0028A5DEE6
QEVAGTGPAWPRQKTGSVITIPFVLISKGPNIVTGAAILASFRKHLQSTGRYVLLTLGT